MSSFSDTEEMIRSAQVGFDHLFANDLSAAEMVFGLSDADSNCATQPSPFHLLGLGICALIHNTLFNEDPTNADAMRYFTQSQQCAEKHAKLAKLLPGKVHRSSPGVEWEVLYADATILLALVHACSNTVKGHFQCFYILNKAYSRLSKLFKTLYHDKLDAYLPHTPSSATDAPSQKSLDGDIQSEMEPAPTSSSRWRSFWSSLPSAPQPDAVAYSPEGPVEEFIASGVAFGYGVFGLLLSFIPDKLGYMLTICGYKHDRQFALKALAVSAARKDVHSIFAGVTFMTYYCYVLQGTGYLAKEEYIMQECTTIAERISVRYPEGLFWVFSKVQVQCTTRNLQGSIATLQAGLQTVRKTTIPVVNAQLAFELGQRLLQARRYAECLPILEQFMMMDDWSQAVSLFLVAGCYIGMKDMDGAQKALDELSLAIRQRGKRRIFIEKFINDQLEFYKWKQTRCGGDPRRFAECVRINPAEVLGAALWNSHAHADKVAALVYIEELVALTPPVNVEAKYIPYFQLDPVSGAVLDLNTPDELALRALMLGIAHRTLGDYGGSRKLLSDAIEHASVPDIRVNDWVRGVAHLDLAVVEMREGERAANAIQDECRGHDLHWKRERGIWQKAVKKAKEELHKGRELCRQRGMTFSGMLKNRIRMLEHEIETKVQSLVRN